MQISFLGATGTVTGSKYLVEYKDKKVLIDCGLFQGFKELRLRNRAEFPIDPALIDAVILTHAHIDHSGYIPLLIKNGFKGKVYCSSATYDLCKILLPDSGYLHEEDARRANRYGYTRHKPALALYTRENALTSLEHFKVIDFGKPHYFEEDFHFTLSRSGHILGSAFVSLIAHNKTITFSGDLGRPNDPIMKPPARLQHTDYLLIESTYGDRRHDKGDPCQQIGKVIKSTAAKGGTILIPTFAVGRAQSLLYYIHKLKQQNAIPDIPVYMDSPMATNATNLLCRHNNEHILPDGLCGEVCNTAAYTRTVEDSKALNNSPMPKVIISASGMATGGRILHHLINLMGDPKNTILFTGFQAGGTRGERIVKGEEMIKIHGNMHKLRAKVESLQNISAHADYQEILAWLRNFKNPPRETFITHGNPEAALS
ncbi:MAG: MBL fold metallo-hydrolase, partial [Kordiimonadaceae bacterium]|nr:MBL fold metallo-hydrolase [Kordiimonadaceae bacterium]